MFKIDYTNIIDLNPEELSQEELDFFERSLENRTDEDSKIIYRHIIQEQQTRNELFEEMLDRV